MERMFTLTSYVQLREQFRSSMTPFLETGRESLPIIPFLDGDKTVKRVLISSASLIGASP
jgi:hypothetical protein